MAAILRQDATWLDMHKIGEIASNYDLECNQVCMPRVYVRVIYMHRYVCMYVCMYVCTCVCVNAHSHTQYAQDWGNREQL